MANGKPGAPKGSKNWHGRLTHGRGKIFETPDDLWNAAVDYFEWVEQNPLWETKVTHHQGVPVDLPVAKMRAMSLSGLRVHLGIGHQTWLNYEKLETHKEFHETVAKIKDVIWAQKFEGSAADLLNASIIYRELGLVEKKENEVKVTDTTPRSIDEFYKDDDDAES